MENSTNTHQQNNNLLENKTTFLKESTQVSDYYKVPIPPEFKKFIDESKNEYLKLLNEKYGHRLQQNQQFKISLILINKYLT